MDEFREKIIGFLKSETKLENIQLEVPPNSEMGDFAFPCFVLSKEWKKSPNQIAEELSKKFKPDRFISSVKVMGPYLNFFVVREKASKEAIEAVLEEKEKYGSSMAGKNKKIILEHTSINPNASPHVGRARNALIGDSLARILRFEGYDVEVHYFVNDVGKQIAMLVLGSEGKKKITFEDLLGLYIDINTSVSAFFSKKHH